MEKSDFELYYHKGGTYILPIETFNEIFDEMESWKKDCKQKENIIKEVREYITNNYNTELSVDSYYRYEDLVEFNDILKILDKGSDKE